MHTTTTTTFEGHRPEPVPITKMDTSLEHALNKHNDLSLLSPSSATSELLNSDRGCHHNKLVHYDNYDNCFHCGAYISKTGSKTFNSKKMSYVAYFPPKTIYETMTRRSAHYKQSMNSEYCQIRHTYVEWVLEIADKLKISANSSHLAIVLLDTIMFKDTSLTSRIQLYAPVCLLIAAKTIELDERIPFIPKLRRYANPTFSVDEYRKAELHILDMVDWNAQFSTAVEISEFLMCQGVLFSTDEIEDNIISTGKSSPEALRENNGNTNHTEVKGEDKKELGFSSPSSKENNENSYSENSTGAESAAVVNAQQAAQQGEDVSPAAKVVIPVYHKQQTAATFESHSMSVRRTVASVEKKAGDIMSHFESNYVKLSTLLVKDVEFVEWEPKVVAASMMAFFRCINRITPIWNGELEAITQLKFVQISSCFDLIYKKYNTAFNLNTPKALNVISVSDNQDLSDYKFARANSIAAEKAVFAQPKTELSNKTNIINNTFNAKPSDNVLNDAKAFERRQIFAYQAKANIPAANSTTAASSNHMRDDLRFRTKYANGTINTEIPQRTSVKGSNYPSNYQTARYNASQEYAASYYNNSANASFSTAVNSYSSAGGSLIDTSYVKAEAYPSRNPSISILNNNSFENYQAKPSMLKK